MHHQYKYHLYSLKEFLISCSFYFMGYLDGFQNNLQEYSVIQIYFSYEIYFSQHTITRASKAHQYQILV